ncbi:MAG: glycosyltransferase family 39 protein [Candidatus Levyibacteriota bacterium]|jgi:4-amino-4-deoxy-L-arabinose transferase-like glycosyltransferase
MKLVSQHKWEIVFSLLLAVAYFVLRLIFLSRLPIFTDEAIYVRWAQIALHDSSWRFISLTDGKQPMYVWVVMALMKFIRDPLIAGRLVSVATGFATMLGLFALTLELFKNKRTAFLVAALYIVYPFAQVLDRMALYDSMVATFYVWALYFSVLLVRKVRLEIAYTLGFVIGGGVLTKSSNFFSIYLLPLLLILFDFKQKKAKRKLGEFVLLAVFAAAISYGLYSILRLSPLYEMIATKNATFVYPFSQWIQHPFAYFLSNLNGLTSWLLQYLTPSFLILVLLAILFINKFFKEKIVLLLYFVLPFLALALFGKIIYPRFVFLMSLMLLPLAAWSLNFLFGKAEKFFAKKIIYSRIAQLILLIVVIVYPLYVSTLFAVNPLKAPIADADHGQYTDSWAAGWGVKESIAFFEKQAQNQKIFIATEGTFGLLPESLEMYMVSNKNVTIKGYWPVDIFPKDVLAQAAKMPAYFVFYQSQHVVIPVDFPLKLVFEVQQGDTSNYYRVYQISSK